ncbi:MAG: DUF1080 domain-containing protein [Pirellulaceae bacterium]|nr:DUF1080 domain-containing protein [Pirellulaceae bacterium]
MQAKAVAFIGVMLSFTVHGTADDWPQFRGPNCSGISTTSKPLPAKFSETDNVLWSKELGDGVGCPVVVDGRVFISAMVDPQTVGLYAFDATNGSLLWMRKWETGLLNPVHESNSHASTTPAADSERVYFYFSTLGMIAVDTQTGEDVWRCELPVPFYVFKWGPAMSPVLYKNLLLFVQDDDLLPAFYAIDKTSGEIQWKDDRHDMSSSYSHPVINQTEQGDEIIVAGTGLLIGYDPATGKRRWHAKSLLRNIKTTPVCRNGTIFVSIQSGGIANQWLASADQAETGNNDGKLSKAEVQAMLPNRQVPQAFYEKTFGRGDLNGDGFLEGEELDLAFLDPNNVAGARFNSEKPADEYIMAIRGGGSGDVTDTHVLWKHRTKHTDHIVSPMVLDGRMLLVKGGGIATCFELEEGAPLWGPKRIRNASVYLASPIYGDGKIFMAGENGFVVVMENGPELKVLAKNDMGDSIIGTPAIAEGRLFVRTRSKLICISDEAEFTTLFDGKSLQGWTGDENSYRLENGHIVCVKGSSGNLFTEKEYADFDFRFEFRLTPGANNGLGIRCPLRDQGNLNLEGTELQILDDSADKYKDLNPYQYHGSVYGVVPAKRGHQKKVGEWNSQQVICHGPQIKVVLNGVTIIDANLDEASTPETLDKLEHPGLKRKQGHIGFLGHGDVVEFRNIRVKELMDRSAL